MRFLIVLSPAPADSRDIPCGSLRARLFLKLQNTLISNSRLVPTKINRDSRVILLNVFLVNLSTEWLDLLRYKIPPFIGVDTSEGRT